MNQAVDGQRVIAELRELHALTGDKNGAQRLCWSPTWRRAREWMGAKLDELPVEVHVDDAGNTWATLPGDTEEALLIGGHIDSVPNGGWLDGSLNLVAGLEVLRSYAGGQRPARTLRLVDWADEEGARFGHGLFGSGAASGTLNPAKLSELRDGEGRSLPDVLAEHDINVNHTRRARAELDTALAYVELHIEQGPVLEQLDLALGAVTGTVGVERHVVTFTGEAAHAGSTPMQIRRDPLAAASRMVLAVRDAAIAIDGKATVGSCVTEPGIATAVAATCRLIVDQRHLDAEVLSSMVTQARATSQEIAQTERVDVKWQPLWNVGPITFDPELVALADQAIREVAGTSHRLSSGPLHDAAEMQRAGVPTVMLFVQSLRGLSHNSAEDTKTEHLELSVRALALTVERVIGYSTASSASDG